MNKRKQSFALSKPQKLRKLDVHSTSRDTATNVCRPLLDARYTKVQSLREFLISKLPVASKVRRKRIATFDADYPEHAGFLDTTVVGVLYTPTKPVQDERQKQLSSFTQTQRTNSDCNRNAQRCNIDEIVSFTIWSLFQKDISFSRRPDHILCHGFQRSATTRADASQPQELIMPGIVKQATNANVDSLRKAPWSVVLALLGDDGELIMCALLLDCSLFTKLATGKDNHYQLSGQPLYHLDTFEVSSLSAPSNNGIRSRVKPRQQSTINKPSTIVFVRNRMYHARPSTNKHGQIELGLKHIHVFNRYGRLDDDLHAVRVMQYVFPKQFGLHNVFSSKVDVKETVQPFKDYTIREQEIEAAGLGRKTKIPSRLRGLAQDLIRRIRKRHKICSYTQLLRNYCSLECQKEGLASSHLLSHTDTSTNASGINTQERCSINHLLSTQTVSYADHETSFLPHTTPASKVSAFCQATIRRILPDDVFGIGHSGRQNWLRILAMIDKFIIMRRFESISLHEVSQGVQLRCIQWLQPRLVVGTHKLAVSDKTKRLELLHEFIYFVFDSLLIPLVRSNFYVTETGIHRNKLSYFRHDIWRRLSEPSLVSLRMNVYQSLNRRQLKHAFQSNKLGHSQVRLLPKQLGARPITNLRRRGMRLFNGKRLLGTSINTQLAPVFSVLNYERQQQPDKLASALFSVEGIRERLSAFRQRTDVLSTQLYFVKVDIQSCFDTIPQDKLLMLINSLLSEEGYHINKYVESKQLQVSGNTRLGKTTNKFIAYAQPSRSSLSFSSDTARGLASSKKKTVFAGTDQERLWQRQQVQKLLTDHVQHNIVRIGRKHFRQIVGIPQGSVLSSLLCSFFYADFEHHHLNFLDPQASLLLRLIDDFLLITTDQSQAIKFIDTMSHSHANYGITVSPDKSLVNFEAMFTGHKLPRIHGTTQFPYCGIHIDTQTLELTKDRLRKDLFVENALTIDVHGRAGNVFQRRILSSLRIQLHAMLLDKTLNRPRLIIVTLFESFLETTMKMHCYRNNMPRMRRPGSDMMIAVCKQLISLAAKRLRVTQDQRHVVSRSQICWIAATAMIKILTRKQSEYMEVLAWLINLQNTSRRSMKCSNQELDEITRSGMLPFQGSVY